MKEDNYVQECLQIRPEKLQEEFCRVPSDLSYWGEQYASALREWKHAKLHRERVEARLHLVLKETLAATGTKATVKDLEAHVHGHEDYEAAKNEEVEKEATHLLMKTRFWAVSAKKDLVQSMGAQIRAEMSHDPLVRDSVRAHRLEKDKDDDF